MSTKLFEKSLTEKLNDLKAKGSLKEIADYLRIHYTTVSKVVKQRLEDGN